MTQSLIEIIGRRQGIKATNHGSYWTLEANGVVWRGPEQKALLNVLNASLWGVQYGR